MAGMERAMLYLAFSAPLEALLEKPSDACTGSRVSARRRRLARQAAATAAAAGAPKAPRTLELLLDVELPVSVLFWPGAIAAQGRDQAHHRIDRRTQPQRSVNRWR